MAGQRLFIGLSVVEVTRASSEAVGRRVAAFSAAELLANSPEDLIQAVIDDKVVRRIVLDIESHRIDNEVVSLSSQRGVTVGNLYLPHVEVAATEAIKVSLYIPYAGTRQAFTYRPSRMPLSPPDATVTDREVILSNVVPGSFDAATAEKHLLDQEENLLEWVKEVNADIGRLEQHIRGAVSRHLAQRREVLERRDNMAASFTIPLRRVEPGRALEIPVRRTAVVLKTSPASVPGSPPEWKLTEAVYEQMIKTTTGFGHALERRPASARLLLPDEETLRDWLMFMLSANYEAPDGKEIFVGGETENGKGKTDILIRHQGRNAFIGECKFWAGQKKFGGAIDQLLGYTVWRDTKAAMILFITNRNATAAIDNAGGCLAAHSACRAAPVPADPYQRRDYRFASQTDDQRMISLALLPVVVPKA